ncbi:MAG: glycosyltransferase family 2 protein, partial [Kaistella sp.]
MKISVIIPVYNAAAFLRKAVESALKHTEVEEVVLIEDASPDHSLEICKELVSENKKVKLFQNKNIEGVVGAIGTEFLSEKGKIEFEKKFRNNQLTTVNHYAEG